MGALDLELGKNILEDAFSVGEDSCEGVVASVSLAGFVLNAVGKAS